MKRSPDVFAIRPAFEDDLPVILDLQRAIPTLPQWSEAAWQAMLSPDPSAGGTHLVSVARTSSALVGYITSNLIAGELELEALAVAEAYRRHGLGRALCHAWMSEAESLRARRLLLEVRESNVAAIALYRSLGFAESGRRAAYYSAPVEDALLMDRLLV